jgi:hypothetical protein
MAEWWRGAVLYQIYPRSFADSDGDGVGDLRGITARLEYVASLGVDGIWISPFFRSPMKDYGYDVSDYCDVDPVFGTLADFDDLLSRAHQLGLKVLIDQVYSHTSDEHPWFEESRSSRENPKADWYVWADAKPDGSPPNNWQAVFGGPAWQWDLNRRQYYLHNFLTEQPDLNFHCPALQDAILETARFWLDRGVDGFRLDVANFYAHDPQLRDNPARESAKPPLRPYMFQRHVYDRSRPETLDFMRRLRAVADSYPDRMLLGEIECEDPLGRQLEYVRGTDALHTAYSFFLLRPEPATPTPSVRRCPAGPRPRAGRPGRWATTTCPASPRASPGTIRNGPSNCSPCWCCCAARRSSIRATSWGSRRLRSRAIACGTRTRSAITCPVQVATVRARRCPGRRRRRTRVSARPPRLGCRWTHGMSRGPSTGRSKTPVRCWRSLGGFWPSGVSSPFFERAP